MQYLYHKFARAFVVLNLPIFVPSQWNEDNKLSRPNYVALLPAMAEV
jgi:hypothetical protein